jgi:hypothetical protein
MKNSLLLSIVLMLIGSTESKAKERHLFIDSIIQATTIEQLTTRFANPKPIDSKRRGLRVASTKISVGLSLSQINSPLLATNKRTPASATGPYHINARLLPG